MQRAHRGCEAGDAVVEGVGAGVGVEVYLLLVI
jgi:hypothetical protein